MGKSSGSPPEPDYKGAAEAKAAGDLEAARAAAAANRVNQVTPYGNLTYSNTGRKFDQVAYDAAMDAYRENLAAYGSGSQQPDGPQRNAFGDTEMGGMMGDVSAPAQHMNAPVAPKFEDYYTGSQDDGWTATQTLSPDQQALLDQQNKTSLGLASLADAGLGYVRDTLSKPFSMEGSPEIYTGDNAWNQAYNAIVRRNQSQMDRATAADRTQLANQGIMQGSEAYRNAMDDRARANNDFLLGAQQQAGQEDSRRYAQALSGRQNYLQEQSFLRNEPLNMLNAVRTGSQVTNPSFANVPQQATTSGADYLGAAQGQNQYNMGLYNSDVASNNAKTGAGVGAVATIAAAFL